MNHPLNLKLNEKIIINFNYDCYNHYKLTFYKIYPLLNIIILKFNSYL